MKISDDNLKALYREYLKDTAPSSRELCPGPEVILRSMRSPRNSKRKAKILNHVSHCFHCAQEFDYILNTLREEAELNQGIRKTVFGTSTNKSQPSSSRTLLKLVPAVAVLLVVIISMSYFGIRYIQDREFRSLRASPLKLEYPIDRSIVANNLVFKWAKITKVNHYIIEVFDESLLPIWKSEDLYSTQKKPPPELLRKLDKNKSYFWMVTAILSDGKKLESHLEGFSIKK